MIPDRINLFSLGRIVATPGATDALQQEGVIPQSLLRRHSAGDWGDIPAGDAGENECALAEGGRILSAYLLPRTRQVVWIVTECSSSSTTLLLPSGY